jgi:alkylation response protein AidB-like acyl-CoA dehydrogenase
MNHEAAVSNAKEIADRVLAPAARENDKEGRFSSEAIRALGPARLLGIMLPVDVGGSGLGPRTFAATVSALAEADASVAMVYLMHVCAAATIAAARNGAAVASTLREIAAGRHLSTLAFSEAGSRSHFWAPVSRARRNGAGVHITAKKSFVTSAGQADSYVVSTLAPQGAGPTDSTLYLIASGARGLSVAGAWDGLGLRANASAPMILEDCEVSPESQLTDDGAGFQAMLQVVLPLFNLGSAAVALGICRAAVAGTATHLKSARFESFGSEPRRKPADFARADRNDANRHRWSRRTDRRSDRPPRASTRHYRAACTRIQGGRRRRRNRRHVRGDAHLRRGCVRKAHGDRTAVPRCPCRRRDGAHGRCVT